MYPTTSLELLRTPEYKKILNQCIHCGLCLPACPTYAVFATEMDAPRGRIQLMRAVSEGRISFERAFRQHIELCLACRACEPACPSGVQYGVLVEKARIALEQSRSPGLFERILRRLVLQEVLPYKYRLRLLARLMWIYQTLGLQTLVRKLNFLPKTLRVMEALLPPLSLQYPDYGNPALALGKKYGDVAFFFGCVQDAFLPEVNAATIRVLQRNGYTVHFPAGQTCCGAAQLHVGEESLVRRLARQNIDAFLQGDYQAIVTNAGGCGAALKEYPRLFADDPLYLPKAERFAAMVKDVSEFLSEHLNTPMEGALNLRVTYQDSCHLRNVQQVINQPRDLLRAIPGVELVEMKQPDHCCGSAGIYNILHVDTAKDVLETKMVDIAGTGADVIATTNVGCQLQLLAGVRQAGLKARVAHVVQLLDQSYSSDSS